MYLGIHVSVACCRGRSAQLADLNDSEVDLVNFEMILCEPVVSS